MARILVVDDNALNRKLACDLLELEGHAVVSAEDATQALAQLALSPGPDLVLMDISLPGMDGLALTRQIHADPRFTALPIVAMTAFAMKGDEQKAREAGCSGYITKPIDTRQFPQQVAAALAAGRNPPPEQLCIMVVEDHRIDLKLVGDSARLSGHLVLSNTTAEEALARLDQGRPDVLLLDLNLPGMNGLSFLRLIKADPARRHLPVVAVTAYHDQFQRQALLDAGCVAYLVKPLDMQELLRELERAAASRGAAPAG